MSLQSINSNSLRALLPLTERREKLAEELKEVESAIDSILAGSTTRKLRRGDANGVRTKARRKRGSIKEAILKELQAAGKSGVSVKELSEMLGVKNQNIHVWFASTGKKLGAKRIGPGTYSL